MPRSAGPTDFTVVMHPSFLAELDELAEDLELWASQVGVQLKLAMQRIGMRWQAEAVKRVPVDTSRLKQAILWDVRDGGGRDSGGRFMAGSKGALFLEVGTNVGADGTPYPLYLEFGTRFIAGGQVLALGDRLDVTDADAITSWPAKDADAIEGNREQMPWLRPSFWAIEEWVRAQLAAAMKPPA